MIALQKLWKMFFISFHLFLTVSHSLGGWSKINLKFYDVINCLNKNFLLNNNTFCLISGERKKVWHWNFVHWWGLNKENKEKIKENKENVHQKLVPDSFLLLVNISKQPLQTRNYYKNKIFWKRITKKP